VILGGYTLMHMAGNLQIFGGSELINHYAGLLHASMGLLWTARIILLTAVVLHIRAALSLYALKAAARPVGYEKKGHRASTLASRTMIYSGYALFAFIVYHILHFTVGVAHPDFVEGDVFHNVTTAFKNPLVAGVYLVSMGMLWLHLSHGIFSLTQSLGLSHPRYAARAKSIAAVFALVVAAGFAVVPIAVIAAAAK
jgi:succinate dehydrogenase / fumarate reductase, cytochrome b subunit